MILAATFVNRGALNIEARWPSLSDKESLREVPGPNRPAGSYRDVHRRVIQFYRLSYEQQAPTNIQRLPRLFHPSLPLPHSLVSQLKNLLCFCAFVLYRYDR